MTSNKYQHRCSRATCHLLHACWTRLSLKSSPPLRSLPLLPALPTRHDSLSLDPRSPTCEPTIQTGENCGWLLRRRSTAHHPGHVRLGAAPGWPPGSSPQGRGPLRSRPPRRAAVRTPPAARTSRGFHGQRSVEGVAKRGGSSSPRLAHGGEPSAATPPRSPQTSHLPRPTDGRRPGSRCSRRLGSLKAPPRRLPTTEARAGFMGKRPWAPRSFAQPPRG